MEIRGSFILEIPRADFLTDYWDYGAGDHVTFAAPNGWGKTTLAMQLIEVTASPKLPVINFAGKPRDAVMSDWTKRQEYQLTRSWPPSLLSMWRKPAGYTVWPPHTGDEDIDDALHASVFRKTIRYWAKKGRCILHCDEFGEFKELGLDKTTRAIHRRGRSNGVGLWGGVQGMSYNETHAYSQAIHFFFGRTGEKRHRERMGDVGAGIDARLIEEAVRRLPDFHWLYIRRRGQVMCIVGP